VSANQLAAEKVTSQQLVIDDSGRANIKHLVIASQQANALIGAFGQVGLGQVDEQEV
jgi:N-acetylglutamate synthase/N-acetylornithine aminotransferase